MASPEKILFALRGSRWLITWELMQSGPMTVQKLAKNLEFEQSRTSHNLSIMREIGVVTSKRVGKNIYYRLTNSNAFIYMKSYLQEMVVEK